MSGKVPHAAFCEEYDEDAHVILPDTRQVANSKRSRSDLRSAAAILEPLVDGASDSGYSSRTAATVNSTQSGPSGRKSPAPLKVDTAAIKRPSDLQKVRSSRKESRVKDRSARPAREDKMQVGAYPPGVHHAPSPSRARGRETAHIQHYPGTCWECDNGLYHGSSTAVEPRTIEYPYYSQNDYPPPPPSPRQAPRYHPSAIHDIHVSQSSRPHGRSSRQNAYHPNGRPMSFHSMMPGLGNMMYNPSPMSRYEHGPPLSSSAYANTAPYGSSPYSQSGYYGMSDYMDPPEHHRDQSVPRTREPRRRRGSYAPVVDYDIPTPTSEDGEPLEHVTSRDSRPRLTSSPSYDHDEDFYRMPPPPLKQKSTPHIIQKKRPDPPRKSASTASVTSERRHSKSSFDMSDLESVLPDQGYRRSSRETIIPERSRSLRTSRRPASSAYREASRPARIAIEGARRRRQTVYDYDEPGDEIEEKQRDAEEYQASRSAKAAVPVPLTADALCRAKTSRAESDSGSQKSRSNSSRGSDSRTQNGSNVGSKPEDDSNIVMTMNGVTMSFTQESVGGKRISVRTGDTGQVELNIDGGRKPKKYIGARSDYTGGSGSRRELEDLRRPRDERRSDRASRRSSRSTYSGRFLE